MSGEAYRKGRSLLVGFGESREEQRTTGRRGRGELVAKGGGAVCSGAEPTIVWRNVTRFPVISIQEWVVAQTARDYERGNIAAGRVYQKEKNHSVHVKIRLEKLPETRDF